MSERVNVNVPLPGGKEQQAHVLLEGGPRTLRPNGLAVLELVSLLDVVAGGRVHRAYEPSDEAHCCMTRWLRVLSIIVHAMTSVHSCEVC